VPKTDVKKLPAALIVNTRSRRGAHLFKEAQDALEAASFNLMAAYPVRHPNELIVTVEQALSDGAELIILGSGDGTVSEVVDSLAHHKAILGFLPLGTTNNFARTLGIPLGLKDALLTLSTGKVAKVSLGLVDDDYFANVSAIGLSASIAKMVTNTQKRWLGRLAYAFTGIRAIMRQRPFSAVLTEANGKTRSITAWQIVVANGKFHAGRQLSKRAHIARDSLTVYFVEGTSRWALISAMLGYWLGVDQQLKHVTYFETRSVKITTDPVQQMEIDGEVKTETPIHATLAPGALKIIVPKTFDDNIQG